MKKRIWWDIESSELNADWGSIFCIGYQIEGEPIECISITDFQGWEKEPWNDKHVVAAFLKVLSREDVAVEVTHYGTLFDLPYVQARASYHHLGVVPTLGHVDTYFIAKSKLKVKSKRLGSLADFLGVRFKKTPLTPDIWRRAGRADREALDYIKKHCIADIRVLKQVYFQLAPLMKRHPVMGDYGDCHNCCKAALINRGIATGVLVGPRQRFQCKSCGAWSTRKAA